MATGLAKSYTFQAVLYAHRKSAGEMEMGENLAYGHVSTGQVGVSGGEEVYDNL